MADFPSLLPGDPVLNSLQPMFEKAAALIRSAMKDSRPILMRFNNDADGICSGLSIYRAVLALSKEGGYDARKLLRDYQNNSAIYEFGDASGDVLLLRGISDLQPLIVLLDFGANSESVEGLKVAKGAGAQLLAIDHHPPNQEAVKMFEVFVSPWTIKGGTSDYCAGLISGEVATRLAPLEFTRLQRIALAGDRSRLIVPSDDERNAALALDYLADTVKPRNTLAVCDSVVSNANKLQSTYKLAISKLEQARASAKAVAKIRQLPNGFTLALADISKFLQKGEFPPRGKVTGALHDSLSTSIPGPLVTIGYGKDAINIRANAAARQAGLNSGAIINNLKSELPNAISSGGGHDVAASIRPNEGFTKIVLNEFVAKVSSL